MKLKELKILLHDIDSNLVVDKDGLISDSCAWGSPIESNLPEEHMEICFYMGTKEQLNNLFDERVKMYANDKHYHRTEEEVEEEIAKDIRKEINSLDVKDNELLLYSELVDEDAWDIAMYHDYRVEPLNNETLLEYVKRKKLPINVFNRLLDNLNNIEECEVIEALVSNKFSFKREKLIECFNETALAMKSEIAEKDIPNSEKEKVIAICNNCIKELKEHITKRLNNQGLIIKPSKELLNSIKEVYKAKLKYKHHDNDIIYIDIE
ncbi:hypothetical protein [Ligilactobacillus cholophilus]|uniref:hypothetical protein n=1 Tax=Ligilactobacillus cholophilus TaxID=3050131 RepID=UPI0025B09BAC|nr:hypothetical protein [Ligilactobacillus cholophilus]